jgi:hypothetical protein
MMVQEVCQICNRQITNPICTKCNTKHFVTWFNRYKVETKKQEVILNYISKHLIIESNNSDTCVICNSENVSICSYCFYYKLDVFLSGIKIPKAMIEDFSRIFNYQLNSDEAFNPDFASKKDDDSNEAFDNENLDSRFNKSYSLNMDIEEDPFIEDDLSFISDDDDEE